jgi:septal ring factor EnvC (AmiA/AmiB activator)
MRSPRKERQSNILPKQSAYRAGWSGRLPTVQYLMRLRYCKPLAALGLAILLAGGLSSAHATKITERSKQKQIAESERAALRKKLADLKRDIQRTETAKGHAADQLAQSEAAISEANRSLHELVQEQREATAKLNRLTRQLNDLVKAVDLQQKKLASMLREQYVTGNEDRIKLLLSGDNPNRISRDLQYMGYMSQAQAKLVESLRINLQVVEENKAEAENVRDELAEIAEEERTQKAQLEKQKANRAALLARLSSQLAAQRKQAGTIERDDRRLAGLVNELAKLIEQQRKADAAEAKRRRLAAAKAKAEQERQRIAQAKNNAKKALPAASKNPNAIDADENPSKSLARNELTPEPDVQNAVGKGSFSALRGQLRLPVQGDLLAKYGTKRSDGPNWKGLFIRAAEGAEIKAVADGQVVFADWLRGFGNLIIVDHGNQYMTIYGNNQAVLKRAGDSVKIGEVIASAGNSGGNEQSGLYFEMRHQGRAFDPLAWMVGLR